MTHYNATIGLDFYLFLAQAIREKHYMIGINL